MKKFRESFSNKKFIASFISLSILSLLFIAGPVQAFVLGLNVDNESPKIGENITFTANIDLENMDKYLPIRNISLILIGPTPSINAEICIFEVDGKIKSGCEGMIIKRILNKTSNNPGYGYGYGYGYDSENGYGYDFGYGYGYGYGKTTLQYEITLDTTNYSLGTYKTFLDVLIGKETFSKEGVNVTILANDEGKKKDKPGTYSSGSNRFYYSTNSLLNNSSDSKNETNATVTTLKIEGDEIPQDKGLFSTITGAVTGQLGIVGAMGAGAFIILVIGSFGFVKLKRKFKK